MIWLTSLISLTLLHHFWYWQRLADSYKAEYQRGRHESGSSPRVSILVCCYNESETLLSQCLASCMDEVGRYSGRARLLVVDDGSSDATCVLRASGGVGGDVTVVQLPSNVGKRRAQDAGLRHIDDELVLMVDSDTVLEPGALSLLVRAVTAQEDIGASTGNLRALPEDNPSALRALFDMHLEMLCETGRAAQSHYQAVLCCSGALSIYRRDVLDLVWKDYLSQRSGSGLAISGEDMYLTLLILGGGYRSVYVPDAAARTAAPKSFAALIRQQTRWSRGHYRDFWFTTRIAWRTSPRLLFDLWFAELSLVLFLVVPINLATQHHSRWEIAAILIFPVIPGILAMTRSVRRSPVEYAMCWLWWTLFSVAIDFRALMTRRTAHWGSRA